MEVFWKSLNGLQSSGSWSFTGESGRVASNIEADKVDRLGRIVFAEEQKKCERFAGQTEAKNFIEREEKIFNGQSSARTFRIACPLKATFRQFRIRTDARRPAAGSARTPSNENARGEQA